MGLRIAHAMWSVTLLLAPLLVLEPIAAFADGAKPKKNDDDAAAASASAGSSGKKYDADNRTAISEFMHTCVQGNAKYAARDFPGAIELYRKAIELNPKHPLAQYLIGEAQLASGNMPEAEAAWSRAVLDSSEKEPALKARILFVVADLKERQKKWDDAKTAWQAYLDWASKFPKAGAFPESAQSRQQVIDAMVKQDKAYEVVRQRIAGTKAGGVFTDLSKSPPAAK